MNETPRYAAVARSVIALIIAVLLPSIIRAEPALNDMVTRVRTAIDSVRFVAYTPTDLSIVDGQVHPASREGIRADLLLLRNDFDGLITYSCADGVEQVPAVASELGYRALILGIWDPLSEREFSNAQELAKEYPHLVVGIAVGNETLLARRREWSVLRAALRRLRAQVPDVAVATSEPFYYYLDGNPPDFLSEQDFLLPSVHPLFEPWFDQATTARAVDFVVRVAERLAAKTDKPVLIKETGLPSGPPGSRFTPDAQAEFWTSLFGQFPQRLGLGVTYFEAFDHDWKQENARREFGAHPEEGYWGLYTAAGRPKSAIAQMRRLWNAQTPQHREGVGPSD